MKIKHSIYEEAMIKPYYEHNGITIYHGDCLQIMPELPQVDLVITDPPYGIGIAKSGTVGVEVMATLKDYGEQSWDSEPPTQEAFDMIINKSKHQIIFGGNYFADKLPVSKCWIVWDKGIPKGFTKAQHELIWTNLTTYSRIIKVLWNGMIRVRGRQDEVRHHPTQKPMQLIAELLSLVRADTVLDPYMGSGTTLVAAKELGRKAIGIELEEKYCEIAVKRLAQEVL